MKMTDRKIPQKMDLDVLLAQAGEHDTVVPSALMQRVLRDAQAVQPLSQATKKPQIRFGGGLRDRFAGWTVLGGMVAASCVGFWIGFNPPTALDGLNLPGYAPVYDTFGSEAAELSGFGWDLEETDT